MGNVNAAKFVDRIAAGDPSLTREDVLGYIEMSAELMSHLASAGFTECLEMLKLLRTPALHCASIFTMLSA
ncbi:MAG: hypothetical protein ABMA13_16240 [Chthoniobacteraceae bacterium]